jgi:hypothetical protein
MNKLGKDREERKIFIFKYLDIYFIDIGTIWMRRRGLRLVLSARCGLEACMHWSRIDVIVYCGFKSVEELYPFPPLGVDSADISQLPKEKNLLGHFQYFQITQPSSSTVTPLYQ